MTESGTFPVLLRRACHVLPSLPMMSMRAAGYSTCLSRTPCTSWHNSYLRNDNKSTCHHREHYVNSEQPSQEDEVGGHARSEVTYGQTTREWLGLSLTEQKACLQRDCIHLHQQHTQEEWCCIDAPHRLGQHPVPGLQLYVRTKG